jgi:uncharacterized repeat protein (TIGR01451 family)
MLAALLLAVGLLLRPALAAPRIQEGAPELTIVKTDEGDGTIAPGATVSFTITITNTGTITATNVTVRDDYDQMALPTIKVLSDTDPEAGGAQNDGDVITWELGDLEPDKEWRASYKATAAESFEAGTTKVFNYASVYVNDEKVAQAEPVGLEVQAPQLTLTLERERVEGEGKIFPGDTVHYTIRYSNNGAADATNVVLEATFDETLVQQVDTVTGEVQRDDAAVRWNLGTVAAGASDDVSYEVTLKPVLPSDTKVRSQATIRADRVEPVSVSDSFALPPLLTIERERKDLNGGAIEPGDTLRFIIRFRNPGVVEASDVVVCDDFDEQVVAEVSDISDGGGEVDGRVEWVLADPLGPGAEKTVSYEVRLIGEIGESTTAANTAIIYISGVEVGRTQTTMTVEPPEPVPVPPPAVTSKENILEDIPSLGVWIFVLGIVCLCMLFGAAIIKMIKTSDEGDSLRMVQEGVCVVLIAIAVLILRLTNCIEEEGTVSILSGIIGYVLGRAMH